MNRFRPSPRFCHDIDAESVAPRIPEHSRPQFGLQQSAEPSLQNFEAKVLAQTFHDDEAVPPPMLRNLSLLSPPEVAKAGKSKHLELSLSSRSCAPRTVQSVSNSVTPHYLIHSAPPKAYSVRKTHRGSVQSVDTDFELRADSTSSGEDEEESDDEYDDDDESEDDDEESESIGTMLFALSTTEEDLFLARRGFEKKEMLCKTLQGELMLAINNNAAKTQCGDDSVSKVVVKKTILALHRERIASTMTSTSWSTPTS